MIEKEGLVFKSTGSWYQVLTAQGNFIDCRLKGKIRLKGIKSTNPVAVGDVVVYETLNNTIMRVKERKNYLIRRSNNLSKYSHIIAANLDLAILIASFKNPRTSQGFIDRFLLTCEAYAVPALIVMNKCDSYSDEEIDQVALLLALYEEIGYKTLMISAKEEDHWPELLSEITGKTSLFSGHSGVGKSTIINKLIPGINVKMGTVSEMNLKGKHTTTFAEMFRMTNDTYIIDTPGIKDFGLVNMEKYEVSHYFREMAPLLEECKFGNCLHVNEPGCAIIKAVKAGEIDGNRYYNYLSIIHGDEEINNPDYLWRKTI